MILRDVAKAIGAGALAIGIATPLVSHFEGRSLSAYYDVVGVLTICDGETAGVKLGEVRTHEECDKGLQRELSRADAAIRRHVKVPLSDTRRAALISFVYNVGEGAFARSTLLRLLNAGEEKAACDQLLRWNKARGIVWPGLTRRRAAERDLCLYGLTEGEGL